MPKYDIEIKPNHGFDLIVSKFTLSNNCSISIEYNYSNFPFHVIRLFNTHRILRNLFRTKIFINWYFGYRFYFSISSQNI